MYDDTFAVIRILCGLVKFVETTRKTKTHKSQLEGPPPFAFLARLPSKLKRKQW